jgi:hypothetical protein
MPDGWMKEPVIPGNRFSKGYSEIFGIPPSFQIIFG